MKKYLFILIVLLQSVGCVAQVSKVFVSDISEVYQKMKPEFTYIHTDKTIYLSGETIWYKTYLLNSPFLNDELSVIVYLELIGSDNEVLLRQKLKSSQGLSHGSIELSDKIPTGKYKIRAYTKWMKNIEKYSSLEQALLIYNTEEGKGKFSFSGKRSELHGNDSSILKITESEKRLVVTLNKNLNISVVAHHKGEILLNKSLNSIDDQAFIEDFPSGIIEFAVFSNKRELIEEISFRSSANPKYQLTLDLNKNVYSPREKAELTLSLKNSSGQTVKGNFSLSVAPIYYHQPDFEDVHFDGTLNFETIEQVLSSPIVYSKEQFIFPKQTQPIDPIELRMPSRKIDQIILNSQNDSLLVNSLFEHYNLTSEILESYGNEKPVSQYDRYSMVYDNVYYTDEYSQMSTVEDFIREIIINAKIKNKGGQKKLRLLNSENRSKVFLYKNDPLLLVDGYVFTDIEEVLKLALDGVKEIDLIWKSSTLAQTSIAKLADNGVFVIHTKSGMMNANDGNETKVNIYNGFSAPKPFLEKDYVGQHSSSERVPDFRSPLYWRPNITIDGKSKLLFYTSDELTKFIVDVKGITEDGVLIHELLRFEVK